MTKKYVITGAACSGKSTTIELANKHHYTIGEVAGYIIGRELEKEESQQVLPWKNLLEFQKKVLELQLKWENEIPQGINLAILDRGIIDGIGFLKQANKTIPKQLEQAAKNTNYEKIFMLEPLNTYENTQIRTESKEQSEQIYKQIKKAYQDFGYQPILVPQMEKQQRLEFILQRI